jgi:hypothetical protein
MSTASRPFPSLPWVHSSTSSLGDIPQIPCPPPGKWPWARPPPSGPPLSTELWLHSLLLHHTPCLASNIFVGLFLLLMAWLIYNLHTIQFTHLKCTIPCAVITTSNLGKFSFFQKEPPYHLAVTPLFSHSQP